ncbi:universal stress protein [Methylobacterium phyllosphaerae]
MSQQAPSPLAAVRDVLLGVAVDGEHTEPSSALGYGLTLAKAAGAHLTVQSASWRFTGDDAWLGDFDDEGFARIDQRLDALARAVADRTAGDAKQAGVICTTEAGSLSYPDLVSRLALRARLHDLVVLDAGPQSFDIDHEMIEKALLLSGRPVIAVPSGHGPFQARKVIVAWDGSAQAARAANDAMPILRTAETVEIVVVGDEAEIEASVPGAEFAPHLARHGVNVTVNDLPNLGGVADRLRAQAGLFQADLIVMGAYRHSRAREFLFGGVTRALLRSSPVPLFLSH